MIIGLVFAGRMKTLENQWIETQFLTIGIPLVPIKSMFVTKSEYKSRQGLDIGFHFHSVLKGYLSFILLVSGIFIFFMGKDLFHHIAFNYLGIVMLIASMYFFFIFGKVTSSEKSDRNLFQKAVGINALPEYLNKETAIVLRDQFVSRIKEVIETPDLNWIDLIEKRKYNKQLLPLLFATMGYHSRVEGQEKYHQLFERLKAEYTSHLTHSFSPQNA